MHAHKSLSARYMHAIIIARTVLAPCMGSVWLSVASCSLFAQLAIPLARAGLTISFSISMHLQLPICIKLWVQSNYLGVHLPPNY